MVLSSAKPWSIVACNLPEHAGNPIHTDEGARAAGFDRALVAGVTSYAYCCHPVLEPFGFHWLAEGRADVRLRAPVFDGDLLTFPALDRRDGGLDVAVVAARSERSLVEMSAWPDQGEPRVEPAGERLESFEVRLEDEYGSEYGARAGDYEAPIPAGVVHPAVWPALANSLFHDQLARGSWVHVRSSIRHSSVAREGSTAEVSGTVLRRFQKNGERVVADVVIRVNGELVATIDHEAIVDVASGSDP